MIICYAFILVFFFFFFFSSSRRHTRCGRDWSSDVCSSDLNLQAKKYPTIMVKTSFNDSQVMYWEPAKYVAKLRTLKPADDTNPLMLKTNMAAGHGGASGRYDFLHDVAFDYAFILTQLGINQ